MAKKKRRKKGKGSWYRSPGVYLEEVSSGARPLEGVGTSTAAFVGFARRHPVWTATAVITLAVGAAVVAVNNTKRLASAFG